MNSWSSLKQCSIVLSEEQKSKREMLSCLPNDLLIRVLSLLPTKCAVGVCVSLNKMMLLPWLTSLDFDASPICHCVRSPNQIERFPLFQNFVDSVIQDHRSPFLTSFRVNVGVHFICAAHSHLSLYGHNVDCFPELKSSQINYWITFPLTRCGLRELDLNIHLRISSSQTQLPPEVFMIETLEVLKLDVNLSFDGISIFCLPNLKTLHLYASFLSKETFLTSLVSNCPILEELRVRAWWDYVHFTKISSSSLRRLYLDIHRLEREINSDLVVLDTPNLEDLEYLDNLALQYSITSMPRLVKVIICFSHELVMEEPEVNCRQLVILLRAFTQVRYLTLCKVFSQNLYSIVKNKQLPVFSDLIYLKLNTQFVVNKNTLFAFLHQFPNMKTLSLMELGTSDSFSSERNVIRREELEQEARELTIETLPWCCRFNLKRVLVLLNYGSVEELFYIEYLLKYLLVLEELVVFTNDLTKHEKKLQNLPRASPTCSIQLRQGHP